MSPPPLPDLTRPVADPSTVAAPLQTPSAANPPPVLANPLAPTLQGIDLNLLAQLKGLAGVSGGLSGLLASTAATAAAPPPVASAPVDRLVQDYDDALVTLDVHLTNSDILKCVLLLNPCSFVSLTCTRSQAKTRSQCLPLRPLRSSVQAVRSSLF